MRSGRTSSRKLSVPSASSPRRSTTSSTRSGSPPSSGWVCCRTSPSWTMWWTSRSACGAETSPPANTNSTPASTSAGSPAPSTSSPPVTPSMFRAPARISTRWTSAGTAATCKSGASARAAPIWKPSPAIARPVLVAPNAGRPRSTAPSRCLTCSRCAGSPPKSPRARPASATAPRTVSPATTQWPRAAPSRRAGATKPGSPRTWALVRPYSATWSCAGSTLDPAATLPGD